VKASRRSQTGIALVLTSIVGVQLGVSLAVTAFDNLSRAEILLFRFALVAAMLIAIWRPKASDLFKRSTWLLALSLAGMFAAFLSALDALPQATVTTIAFLGPLGIALESARDRRELAWVGLAAVGVVLLGRGEWHLEPTGVLLAVMAAGFWAMYIVLMSAAAQARSGYQELAWANLIAAVVVIPFVAVGGLSGTRAYQDAIWAVLAFSALAGLLPLVAELEALKRIRSHSFGVFMSLDPGVAAMWGFLILGQSLSLDQVGAIALVTFASAGAFATASRAEPEASLQKKNVRPAQDEAHLP
jgi:inner membrane transporter RhtA